MLLDPLEQVISSLAIEVLFVNFLSFLPPGVVVCFDETAYSVIEGEEVTIGITANRRFTSSFSLTVTHGDPG